MFLIKVIKGVDDDLKIIVEQIEMVFDYSNIQIGSIIENRGNNVGQNHDLIIVIIS